MQGKLRMLNLLRNASRNWSVKLFLFILLICFIFLWGTSNFNGATRSDVLLSGKSRLNENYYRFFLNKEISSFASNLDKNQQNISLQDAKNYGILQNVEKDMVRDILIQEQTRLFPIGLTKNQLAKIIAQNPDYQISGKFNKNYFLMIAKNFGLTPKMLTDILNQTAKNKQLLSLINTKDQLPQTILKAFHKSQNQLRDVRYIKLSKDHFLPPPPPGDEQLEKWFQAHIDQYSIPEYRTFVTLPVSLEPLTDKNLISQKESEDYYKKHQNLYKIPEKRSYTIISFKDKKDAELAKQEIANGQTFDELKKAWAGKADIKQENDLSKEQVKSPFSNEIFSLKENELSSLLSNGDKDFSYIMLSKIAQESFKPLKEVEDTIKQLLLNDKATEIFQNKIKKIEDSYKKGKSIQEIAKDQNLKIHSYTVDSKGLDQTKNQIFQTNLDENERLLKAVFETDLDVNPSPFSTSNQKRTWYKVLNITPFRHETFQEAYHKIIDRWNDEQKQKMLEDSSREILQKLNKGEKSFESIAQDYNLAIQKLQKINRFDNVKDLDISAIGSIFDTKLNHFALSVKMSEQDAIIFQVLKIYEDKTPEKKETLNNFKAEIENILQNELLQNSLSFLQGETGLLLNPDAFKRVSGNM